MKRLFFSRGAPALWVCMIFLTFFQAGCNKKTPGYNDPDTPGVAGWVEEFGTGKRLPNAKVFAISCEGEILGSITCSVTDTTRTDANGHYEMPDKPEWVNATANGYWADDHYLTLVAFQKELVTSVALHPHAWIEVTIRNESGAWGFGSSQLFNEIIRQGIGENQTVTKLIKGNDQFKLNFFIMVDEQNSTIDTANIKCISSGNKIPVIQQVVSLGVLLNPPGHDTTQLLIIY